MGESNSEETKLLLLEGGEVIDNEQLRREQITAQMNAIASEIRANQPLTSDLYPITHLVDSYLTEDTAEPNFFLQGACYLSHKYKSYRRVRGDGNCYYRAFLYALCEGLLQRMKAKEEGATEEIERLKHFGTSHFVSKRGGSCIVSLSLQYYF
jgi:hypothetical protein